MPPFPDPHPTYTAAMLRDLTGRPGRETPAGMSRAAPDLAVGGEGEVGGYRGGGESSDGPGRPDLERTAESAAIETLKRLGYAWQGGELWKPPLGRAPAWLARDLEHDAIWDAALAIVRGEGRIEL